MAEPNDTPPSESPVPANPSPTQDVPPIDASDPANIVSHPSATEPPTMPETDTPITPFHPQESAEEEAARDEAAAIRAAQLAAADDDDDDDDLLPQADGYASDELDAAGYIEYHESDVFEARAEQLHLLRVNARRRGQVRRLWVTNKQLKLSKAEEMSAASEDQVKLQYANMLDQLNGLWEALDRERESAEHTVGALTEQLDEFDDKATELNDAFRAFKREMALQSVNIHGSEGVKMKRILAFEAEEEDRDREIAEVRLRHVTLANQIRKLEREVRRREKLAEGLHLIDFEQLKIENEALNEKIEERHDELHKLRKKTATTVQVLTHVKEKLQFVRKQSEGLVRQLEELDGGVSELRDRVTLAKRERDALRIENAELKQKQGFISSDMLVADFERRKRTLESRREQVEALQARHARLKALIRRAQEAEKAAAGPLAKTRRRPQATRRR